MSLFARRLNFDEILARQRQKLLDGEEKAVRKLVSTYGVVDRVIHDELSAVSDKIKLAKAQGIDISEHWLFQQERFRQMLAQVRDQVAKYSGASEALAIDRMKEVVQLGLFDSAEVAKASGISGGFIRLQSAELEHIVGAFYDGSPLKKLFGQFPGQAVKKASQGFIKGFALGKNPREIAKDLAADIEGLSLDRAVRIARTESLRAYTTAQAANYKANRDVVLGMRIMSALDARTCPMCWARHGTVITVDEPFYRHVACRCTLVPVTGFESDLGIDMRKGDEIMRSKGPAYARQVLGADRADLWLTGNVGMSDFFKEVMDPEWGPQLQMRSLQSLFEVAAARNGRSFAPLTPISTIGTGLAFKTHYLDLNQANQASVERGLRAIESVHDLEPLKGIDLAISGFTDRSGTNGFMAPTLDSVLSHIGLNDKTPPGPSTFVHEFGHLIDKATLFKGPSPMSIQPGAPLTKRQSKAVARWMKELYRTDEVRRLDHALNTGHFPVDQHRYIAIDADPGLRDHIDYLMSPAELWARSYAQFIAEKSKDRIILREIAAQSSAHHPVDQVRQWQDFGKLGDAVANILKVWGYKLK